MLPNSVVTVLRLYFITLSKDFFVVEYYDICKVFGVGTRCEHQLEAPYMFIINPIRNAFV